MDMSMMFHIQVKLREAFKRKRCHTLGDDVLYSGGTSWSVPEGHVMHVLLMLRKLCELFKETALMHVALVFWETL